MERFAVTNATTGKTQGPYETIEAARAQVNRMVEADDEWEIRQMSTANNVGAGGVIESGRGPFAE